MKRLILITSLLVLTSLIFAQQAERRISIIPEPVSMVKKGGHYVLPDEVVVYVPNEEKSNYLRTLIVEKLTTAPGKKVKFNNSDKNANVVLLLNSTMNN